MDKPKPNMMAGFGVEVRILVANATFEGEPGHYPIPETFALVRQEDGHKVLWQELLAGWMQAQGHADPVAVLTTMNVSARVQAGELIFPFYPAADFQHTDMRFSGKKVLGIQLGCVLILRRQSLSPLQ